MPRANLGHGKEVTQSIMKSCAAISSIYLNKITGNACNPHTNQETHSSSTLQVEICPSSGVALAVDFAPQLNADTHSFVIHQVARPGAAVMI